jgi:hypothetical protein
VTVAVYSTMNGQTDNAHPLEGLSLNYGYEMAPGG